MEQNQSVIYQTEDGQTQIDVRLENDTVWLTQAQMAELFERTPQNITTHLRNAYREGELDKESTCKEYLQVQTEGKRKVKRIQKYYDLDVIISVGYRVKSKRGTAFRIWARKIIEIRMSLLSSSLLSSLFCSSTSADCSVGFGGVSI